MDNPFDPNTDWVAWYKWDMKAGYNTLGLLARFTITSDELSNADQELAYDEAADKIVETFGGFYKRV